jgi:hypothetical protein
MRARQVPDPARQSRPAVLGPRFVRATVLVRATMLVGVAVLVPLAVLVRATMLVPVSVLMLVPVAVLGRTLSVMAGTLAIRGSRIVPVLAHIP